MPPDDTDEGVRLYREAQDGAIADAEAAEAELRPLYRETADDIRGALKQQPDNLNGVQIRDAVSKGFERTLHRRRRIIAKVITESAPKGAAAVRKTFRAKYGKETTRAQVRTSKAAMEEAADRIAGRVSIDNVSLSKRIRAWDTELGGELAREVETGLKSKKGIETIARDIQKIDRVTEGLPQYLQEVEALARKGAPELKTVAKGYLRRVAKNMGSVGPGGTLKGTPYSLRGPTQRFLRDVQKAGVESVDKAVAKYVEEKAFFRAKVIAREESVNAMHRSYVENAKKKPGVYAFRWILSSSHPRADECDAWSSVNDCELGPGVWTAERLPHKHVGCRCVVVSVMDSRHFDREEGDPGPRVEYADKKSPDTAGWLKQDPQRAAAVLGKTRHEAFLQGHRVIDAEHKLILVRDLPGFAQAAE